MLFQVGDLMADQRSAVIGFDTDETRLATGKVHHLECTRIFDQPLDMVCDQLLGADQYIDRQGAAVEQLLVLEIFLGAYAGDLGRRTEQAMSDLAGYDIGLITVCYCDQHIGVSDTPPDQHVGMRGMTGYRLYIETVTQVFQHQWIGIYQRDVIGFR